MLTGWAGAAAAQAPTVTSVSPTSISTAGGASVTINGSNFTGATTVSFGGSTASSFTVNNSTRITATSPALSSGGMVYVRVTTPGGTSGFTGSSQILAIEPPWNNAYFTPSSTISVGGTTTLGMNIFNSNSGTALTGLSLASAPLPAGLTGSNPTTSCGGTVTYVPATRSLSLSGASIAADSMCNVSLTVTGTTAGSYSYTSGTISATGPVSPLTGGTATTSTPLLVLGTPTVSSISPTSGPTAGGTTVALTGTSFTGVTAVKFGAVAAAYSFVSNTQINATAPAGSAGTVDITVTTANGTSATSAADQFTYVTAPTVTSISPTAGPTGGGTTVTITGTGFAAAAGTGAVKFGATNATYTINSNTQITATSPAGSAGTVDVTVATAGGTSATSAADQFTYIPAPTVTSVSPTAGPQAGGTTVTITGTNFTTATAVTFGATAATGFNLDSATQITATAPAGTGTVDIRVTSLGGTSATSAADQFTYVQAPTVTSVSPTAGPGAGGTTVTITGTNFSGATAVTFGATPATGFTVNSGTQITATAPSGSSTVNIRVTTTGGTSATSAGNQYTYVAAPTVTSIAPTAGPTGGGTTVVITGANFSGATAVTFGATAATGFTVNSATQITATAPAGSGTVDVRITTTGGTSATSAADQFTYISAPTVTSISPTAGPTAGGSTVTITGTNFATTTAVTFGATPATGFTVNSATQITATAPAGTGTVDVRVTSLGGTSATSAADQFTFIAAPTLTSVAPTAGPQGGGTTVTVTGLNFAGATAVTFGATAASGFTVNSATSITAIAPAGTGTVDVRITTTGGTSATSAADQYTYVAAPTVTSVSPGLGTTAGGTTVTLAGTGFSGATAVTFGATAATGFTVNSATQITATAPAGTGTVDIRVTTIGGTSPTSAADRYDYVTAPTAANVTGVMVAFNTARAIDLSTSITGNHSSVAVGSAPAHGTTSITGDVIAYTPAASYVGADSFTYTATGVGGTSAPATVSLTVGKGAQTISFPTIPSTSLSNSPVTLAATASSGLPVTYSPATPAVCTVSGSTVTLLQTGTCSVFAGQAGDATYDAAPPFMSSFLVTPANLVVTSNAPSGTVVGASYGQSNVAAGGTAPYSFSIAAGSLPPGTTLNPATGLVSGTPTTGGTFNYVIRATDSQPTPVSSNGSTITAAFAKGAQTISFTSTAPGDAAVAGAPYTVTATTNAGLAVTFSLDGASSGCAISGSTVTFTDLGTCRINADQAGDANWNAAAQVQQSFSIAPNPPIAADRPGVVAPYNSSGLAIDLSTSLSGGPHTAVAVTVAPAHGTTAVAGDVVTYTPATGYFGADSFTYTATGPGGTSAQAIVSLTVTTPAAPVAADRPGVAVAYNSNGAAIDLSASVTGLHSSLAITTAPAHGAVTVSGDVVTYIPAAAYFGADSFTYTATGPGGTSAPATVSLTVATPPAPAAADRSGVAIGYNSSGTAIDLSASITGVHASIAASAPTHGTTSVAGDVVTYMPAAGYHGPDTFTYTATGPGGTSAPATVSLTVATPPPPVIDVPTQPVVTPPPSGGNGAPVPVTVDLGQQTDGLVDGFRITSDARFGSARIETSGSVTTASAGSASPHAATSFQLVYTPRPNFMGTDTVALVAFGPGGDSAPVTFTFQVPGKAPDLTGQTVSTGSATFTPTTGLTGGPFQALRITRAPSFGTAVVQGLSIVFTPGAANGGATSLDYVVDLPFGSSASGRISLTSNLIPAAQALTATTVQGRPVTVRISDAAGGPFTGAAVVSVSPANAGAATVVSAGSGSSRTLDLVFTPTGAFSGQAVVTYTLTNAFATTTSTVTVTVQARPDPALDPEVRGVASTQVTSARRFADAQIGNFQRRLQDLHDGDNGSSNGLSLNLGFGGQSGADLDPRMALRRELGQSRDEALDPGALGEDRSREMLGLDIWAGRTPAAAVPAPGAAGLAPAASPSEQDGPRSPIGVWSAGSVDWGRQEAAGRRDSRFTTQGVSAGLDLRLSDQLIVGAGLGYGEDKTRIGEAGSVSTGQGITGAAYASWRPVEGTYVDGVAGYADLDFTSRRFAAGIGGQASAYAEGDRSGDARFASIAIGRLLRGEGVSRDLYARLDARSLTLDGFIESGAGLASLTWDAVEQDSLSANLGARMSWLIDTDSGLFRPAVRLEWSHEFEDIGAQGLRYADWAASPTYIVPLDAWSRDSFNLDLDAEWTLAERLMLKFGYRGMLGDASQSHGLQIGVTYGW